MNDKQEMFHTANLKAANAIVTFGIEKMPTVKITRMDGRESTDFWFKCSMEDAPSAGQINHWMTKGNAEVESAEAELLKSLSKDQQSLFRKAVCRYLYCYAQNRDELISNIKDSPQMVEITNGTRRALIAANATEETKRKIASML